MRVVVCVFENAHVHRDYCLLVGQAEGSKKATQTAITVFLTSKCQCGSIDSMDFRIRRVTNQVPTSIAESFLSIIVIARMSFKIVCFLQRLLKSTTFHFH